MQVRAKATHHLGQLVQRPLGPEDTHVIPHLLLENERSMLMPEEGRFASDFKMSPATLF